MPVAVRRAWWTLIGNLVRFDVGIENFETEVVNPRVVFGDKSAMPLLLQSIVFHFITDVQRPEPKSQWGFPENALDKPIESVLGMGTRNECRE
ncbi:MAG: hypothetical protein P8M80_13355 [Pirellulaceae bacterium]|nr:hypothetical protein [Pirellulaceae bacterium]